MRPTKNVPFLIERFPKHDFANLAERLRNHLRRLRYAPPTEAARAAHAEERRVLADAGEFDAWTISRMLPALPEVPADIDLSQADNERIDRRAKRIVAAQSRAYAHLRSEERARLAPAADGVPAVMARSVDWADQIAADLHAEMPWMARATEHAWYELRRCAERGGPVRIGPMLLDGPYGIGKSSWARRLAERLALPFIDLDASRGGAGFSLVGTERGWGSAQPGRPVETILAQNRINPLCVVDEICKAVVAETTRGHRLSFEAALLSLLEPTTARVWECPYYRVPVDLSHVSWVLTSNTLAHVAPAVRTRCQIIALPDVTTEDLLAAAATGGRALGLSDAAIGAVQDAIVGSPAVTRRRLSLRDVRRMLDRAAVLEARPMVQ